MNCEIVFGHSSIEPEPPKDIQLAKGDRGTVWKSNPINIIWLMEKLWFRWYR